jgi:signal transduction histidine kinase
MNDSQANDDNWDSYPDYLPPFWKEHYQNILTSGDYSLENIMLDITHEFLVPLSAIQAYAKFIQENIPDKELEALRISENITMKYALEVIIKNAQRQNMMLQFVRGEVWGNSATKDQGQL